METDQDFTDLLRLLADSLEHPDPDCSPLTEIADLGDEAVPKLIEALTHDDPVIRRTAADALGQLRSPVDNDSGSATSGPAPRTDDWRRTPIPWLASTPLRRSGTSPAPRRSSQDSSRR